MKESDDMLTDKDIAFMKSSREQIQTKREQTISLEIEGGYYHELTGEFIEENVSKEVVAILTERSSRTAPELVRQDGSEVREGDLWLSISRTELERIDLYTTSDYDSIKYIIDKDRRYRVVAHDRKGIGDMNRLELLAKVVT